MAPVMAFTASHSALRPVAARSTHTRHNARGRLTVKAGLFDFFKPAPSAPKTNPRAQEIVDELVTICTPTDAGLKTNPELNARVEELAEELQQYCIKNPVKNDLLWGEYEVLYTTKPTSVAGPFRAAAGQVLFPGQKPMQILEAPNRFTNNLEYQTLGFIKGYARQFGEIEVTSGSTFKVTITRQEINTGAGLSQEKEITAYRNFEILYLDEQLRVTRFLPTEGLQDDERDQQQKSVPVLFVFKRLGLEAQEEPEQEGGDEEGAAVVSKLPGSQLFGRKRLEGNATLTERQVRRQIEEDSRKGRGGTGQIRPGTGTTKQPAGSLKQRKQQQQKAVEKAGTGKTAAAEKAAKAAAAEKAAKAAAAEKERKEREAAAERERREKEATAAREKQAAVKELLAKLGQELKERSAAKKDAVTELRSIERGNAGVLKAAAAARSKLEAAATASSSAEEAVQQAKAAAQAAAQQLKESEAELREVEKSTRQLVGAARK